MFVSLDVWGVYVFFGTICFIGLSVLWPWAPETKAVPLERMEGLFSGSWYMGWKAEPGLDDEVAVLRGKEDDGYVGESSHVEGKA